MKSAEITEPGQHTLSEIFSQPQCWSACLAELAASAALPLRHNWRGPERSWIFVGCGTSYYLAQAAAATFNHLDLPAVPSPLPICCCIRHLLCTRTGRIFPL